MKVQAGKLAAQLRSRLAPCYFVSGDEPLLVDEALDQIRAAARDAGFSARERHVASSGFDWSELANSSSNLSLFAERRIVEVRLPTGKPGRAGGQALIDLTTRLGSDLMLLVSAPKLDRATAATKWAKALDSAGVSVTVWPIGVRELPAWIGERMRRAGLKPDRGAVAMIADRVEGNLLAASQEIEKLRLLLGDGAVDAADVARAVADSSRYDVYKLADAAVEGDTRRALKVLYGLKAEGVEPVLVVWSLTRELRTLSRLAEAVAQGQELGAAMQKARVWRNRQGLVRRAVGRLRLDALYGLLKTAARADAAAKGQQRGDPWAIATDIVLGLAGNGREAA